MTQNNERINLKEEFLFLFSKLIYLSCIILPLISCVETENGQKIIKHATEYLNSQLEDNVENDMIKEIKEYKIYNPIFFDNAKPIDSSTPNTYNVVLSRWLKGLNSGEKKISDIKFLIIKNNIQYKIENIKVEYKKLNFIIQLGTFLLFSILSPILLLLAFAIVLFTPAIIITAIVWIISAFKLISFDFWKLYIVINFGISLILTIIILPFFLCFLAYNYFLGSILAIICTIIFILVIIIFGIIIYKKITEY